MAPSLHIYFPLTNHSVAIYGCNPKKPAFWPFLPDVFTRVPANTSLMHKEKTFSDSLQNHQEGKKEETQSGKELV